MNYELVKRLKDAGFPQMKYAYSGWLDKDSVYYLVNDNGKYIGVNGARTSETGEGLVYRPTLSELIGACGESYRFSLNGTGEDWSAEVKSWPQDEEDEGHLHEQKYGDTPEEAVATLWLALNNKQNDNITTEPVQEAGIPTSVPSSEAVG